MKTIAKTPKRSLVIATWHEVRDEVIAVNKQLGSLIDEIDPSDDYKFVKSEYAFGDLPIINGVAQLLTEKKGVNAN